MRLLPENLLESVEEVTIDLSDAVRKIVRTCFPKAIRVIDRFHIEKLACDAVQEMRIANRWDALQEANDDMENAKPEGLSMYHSDTRTGTQEKICWQEAGIFSSSPTRNRFPRSAQEQGNFSGNTLSGNTLTWKRLTRYASH